MNADSPARRPWRDVLLSVSALEALAVALWLLPASVHIVHWPPSGPVRLGLLAPAWQLAVAGSLALVVSGVALAIGGAPRVARIVGPLSILWLWAVPYLPWVPDRAPLLLVLAGPIRWVVLAVASGVVACRLFGIVDMATAVPRLGRRVIFAVSLCLYLVLGLHAVTTVGLGGDEPHYLVITESLLKDHDLKIENNHQRGDYRSFIGGELRPDYMQRGRDGEIYSIHAPGLSLLVLPAYAVAGYLGAVMFIALVGALTALAVFDLSEALAGRGVALATWASICLTVPFVPYSWMLFPEMPGALIAAWSALWVWRTGDERWTTWLVRGLVLASLPWLHTKFIVLLGIFALALGVRLLRRPAALAALAAPIGLSGLAWLYSFYAIYGAFDPEAPYGAYSRTFVINRNIPHGLIGIFLDQKFGLLFYSPIYLLAIAGAWLLWRRRDTRYLAGVLFLVTTAFVASTARLYMFWGGNSAPARFLVPILPCLAPMVAVALMEARSVYTRSLVAVWFSISLAIATLGTAWPERLWLFSDPHGRARILEFIQAGSPLALVVPTFTDPDWLEQVPRLIGWVAAAVAALLITWLVARRPHTSVWKVAGAACVALLAGGGVLAAKPAVTVRDATALRGDTDVLWTYDGNRVRTLDYSSMRRASAEQMEALETMELTPEGGNGVGYTSRAVALPPGKFDAIVWFNGVLSREGDITIEGPPAATFGRMTGFLPNPATVPFELPVGVRRLRVRVEDSNVGVAVASVRIVPRGIPAPSERQNVSFRTIESVNGPGSGYVIYADDQAYPEGGVFWTRATAQTQVFVAPGVAHRLRLTLSLGPLSGEVKLWVSDREQTVAIPANSVRDVSFDLDPGQRLVPIRVQSPVMFRPSEIDPASRDMRRLGCQVRVTLE